MSTQPGPSDRHDMPQDSAPAVPPLTPAEDRQWATIAHFGAIAGALPSLVIYLLFRDRGPFTAQESREALNFTLPWTVVFIVANILALLPAVGWIFGLVAVVTWIFMTISGVIAGIECNKGRPYRYRYNLRLL